MLKELHEHTHWWKYLFPCLGHPRRRMSENTVNAGLRRLGYTSDQMTAHGFRAMAATLLTRWESGIPMRSNANWRMSRSEEHTSELQSLMRISYAVFCLK